MKDNIRVAFFVYPSAFQNIGGGEILLLKTKEYLERKGVYCKLFDIWNDKLDDFDILHVVGSVKDCLGLMETAKNKGIKIILDPIFFSTFQRALYEHGGPERKIASCARHLIKTLFPFFPSDRRKMMVLADAVIPNSHVEQKQLESLFWISKKKMHIVPNCVDAGFSEGDAGLFRTKYKLDNFILSVGRIEPRKNQLNLIRALKGFPAKLVIIGEPVSDYKDYYEECRSAGSGSTAFIGRIGHEDALLKSAYKACSCLVSPGWFETPGLAALEAALAGANIATTDKGCTKEYFLDFAEYFDPADKRQIRQAVEKAFSKERNPSLRDHVAKNFLWDRAAELNLEIYEKVLKA